MSIESNKELLRRFVADVIDGQDIDAADAYLSDNFVHHDQAPGELTRHQTGLKGQKNFFTDVVFNAFSEFRTEFEDMVGEGDMVAGRWRQTSRNTGDWLGRPGTGRTAEIAGISIVRIRDDRIIEEWEARDAIGLFTQLGVPLPRLKMPAGVADGRPRRPPRLLGPPILTNGPLFGPRAVIEGRRHRAVAGRYFADVWNRGEVAALPGLLGAEFAVHDPTGLLRGGEGTLGTFVRALHTGMPDLNVSVDLQLTEGDRVVSRWTGRGTHTGDLLGLPASGNRASFTGISVDRVAGGQIQEEWQLWEQLSLLQQVGAVPG